MKLSRVLFLLAALACAACTTVAPVAPSTGGSPAASFLVPIVLPSGATPPPVVTLPPASELPATQAPLPTATPEPTAIATSTPTAKPTPKPTKKPTPTPVPTPTPSPTPTPTSIDLAIYVNTSDLPNPWYNNTDYTIPIHVSAAVSDILGATVKVSIPEEAFSTTYQTGPITAGNEDVHNVTINVPAIGPATLTLSVKVPQGYADVNPSNNKVSIAIDVQLKP